MATAEQRRRIKDMLVNQLQMRLAPEDIGDEEPLFGPEGLGLDSVDGIEIVAGIEQEFGYAFADESLARKVLANVSTLADFLVAQGKL